MTKPTLNSQISLGNVIQLVVLLVTILAGWFTIDQQSKSAAEAASENKDGLVKIEVRLRLLENKDAKDSEQLRTLQRDIAELKSGQKETNGLLRQLLQRGSTDIR
jgi:hypothetical protein